MLTDAYHEATLTRGQGDLWARERAVRSLASGIKESRGRGLIAKGLFAFSENKTMRNNGLEWYSVPTE